MKAKNILLVGIGVSVLVALKAQARGIDPGNTYPDNKEIPSTKPAMEISENENRVIQYQPIISRYAILHDIEPAIIASVIMQESLGITTAKRYENNGTVAYGLMQMTDKTARALGFTGAFTQLYNPEINISLGATLLEEGYTKYKDIGDSLSYYNGGAVNIVNGTWDNHRYVYGVLSYVSRFRKIWRYIYDDYDFLFKIHYEVSKYGIQN